MGEKSFLFYFLGSCVFFGKKREFNLNSCGQQQQQQQRLKNHQIYYCKRRKCLKTKRKKIQNFSLKIKKVFFLCFTFVECIVNQTEKITIHHHRFV